MITRENITKALCERFDLLEKEINPSDNLFKGQIDSLDFLEFAKVIESVAKKNQQQFSLKDFLYSECYSIEKIFEYLNGPNHIL